MSMLDITHIYEHPIERAIAIASEAHAGQVDKQGRPYILHVLRVMVAGTTDEERIVGVLHDIIEDTEYRAVDLLHLGFSPECVEAIVDLTHTKWQSNDEYYTQIKANPLALAVKRHDVDDNYSRLEEVVDLATRQRLKDKYDRARKVLFGEGNE